MPLYEFECPNSHVTVQLMSYEESLNRVPCPDCMELARKVLSSSNLQFTDCHGNSFSSYANRGI